MQKVNLKTLPMPELYRLELQERSQYDLDFANKGSIDRTAMLVDAFKYQQAHKQNTIWGVYGKGRSGKTYCVFGITYEAECPPTLDTVFFPLEDVSEYLPHLKEGDTAVRDEAGIVPHGAGSKRLEDEYTALIEIMGKKRINFVIISHIPRAVDHVHYFTEGLRLFDKVNDCSYCALQFNDFRTIGHLKIKNPEHTIGKKFIDAYEKKKDDFLNDFLRKNNKDYLSNYALEVIDSEAFMKIEDIFKAKCKKKKRDFAGIPHSYIKELVNMSHPELRRNNEVNAIVDKVYIESVLNRGWSPRG